MKFVDVYFYFYTRPNGVAFQYRTNLPLFITTVRTKEGYKIKKKKSGVIAFCYGNDIGAGID
jgi:hypothetical protein